MLTIKINQDQKIDLYADENIKQFCELLGIKFHHSDTKPYKTDPRLRKATCVVYSEEHGPWRIAFNNDGTITLNLIEETTKLYKLLLACTQKQ